jgi:hypothetical protein
MPAISLLSDAPLVPKEPSPPPSNALPIKSAVCPVCMTRQPEVHACTAIGRSEVILAVGYADSSMSLIEPQEGTQAL